MKRLLLILCLSTQSLNDAIAANVCYSKKEFVNKVKEIVLSKPTTAKLKTLVDSKTKKLFTGMIPGENMDPFDISWLSKVSKSLRDSKNIRYIGLFEFENESFYSYCVGFENLVNMPFTSYAFCSNESKPRKNPDCFSLNGVSMIEDKKVFQ